MIFLSDQLKNKARYIAFYSHLIRVLDDRGVDYQLLDETHDIWLRDFMPIQVSQDRFIEYRYGPDYLKDYPHLRTDPGPMCENIGLNTIKTDIILDGGNVVRSGNCVIMTDKVVWENRHQYSREESVHKLHQLFEVDKVVLVGWDRKDIFGHTDGMVRFIEEQTVLLSDIYASDPNVTGPLRKAGLEYEILEFRKKNKSRRRWAYLNFLQTPDILLLPKLNIPEDDMALERMQYYFPSYAEQGRMGQVDCTSIVSRGGALNCVSWEGPVTINHHDTARLT
jgi:agmatine/peptidylarginine deiminase